MSSSACGHVQEKEIHRDKAAGLLVDDGHMHGLPPLHTRNQNVVDSFQHKVRRSHFVLFYHFHFSLLSLGTLKEEAYHVHSRKYPNHICCAFLISSNAISHKTYK